MPRKPPKPHNGDEEPEQKPVMGRPTLYRPEYVDQAKKLCEMGATDDQIADFFEVDVRTIYRWKHDHEDFCQALKSGKDVADERVERSLYQRAVGYEHDSVKIFMPANATEPVYAPFREKLPPDVTAGIFWLKNRRKEQWRDKQEVEHSGEVSLSLADRVKRAKDRLDPEK